MLEKAKKDPIVLDEVRHAQTKKGAARPPSRGSQATAKPQKPQCKQCGHERHPAKKCPAKNATCYKCNRKGHFSSQCFSKTAAASTHKVSLDSAFLGAVTSQQEPAWTATVLLGKTKILRTDNGLQHTSREFQEFSEMYGFRHITSSPRYPHSNG